MFTLRYTHSRRDVFAFGIDQSLRSPAFLGFHAIGLVFVGYAISISQPKGGVETFYEFCKNRVENARRSPENPQSHHPLA